MVDVCCWNRSFIFVKNPNRVERMDSMGMGYKSVDSIADYRWRYRHYRRLKLYYRRISMVLISRILHLYFGHQIARKFKNKKPPCSKFHHSTNLTDIIFIKIHRVRIYIETPFALPEPLSNLCWEPIQGQGQLRFFNTPKKCEATANSRKNP